MNKKISRSLFAAIAATSLLTLPVLAQTGANNADAMHTDQDMQHTQMEGTTGAATGAAVTTTTTTTDGRTGLTVMSDATMTLTPLAAEMQATLQNGFDRLFLLKAAKGNLAEVMTGQLALRKSKNPQVRQLAQHLISEHGAANVQLMPIITRKVLPMPRTPGVMHSATYDVLSNLKGTQFDQMFMAAQVEAHENSINMYQQELTIGRDADARAYAAAVLPRILEHTAQIYTVARLVRAPGMMERAAAMTTAAGNSIFPAPAGTMGGTTSR